MIRILLADDRPLLRSCFRLLLDAEDDVEGHSMMQNMGISRGIANARERDIQQHLKRHDLEAEARAHKKDRR